MSQIIKNLADGPVPPSVPTSFVTDSGTAVPALNILNVLGGTGTTTSGAGNTITVTVKNEGFTWSEQNVSFAAAVQNGYFCNAALTVTLPTAGLVVGSTIIVFVDTASGVILQAGAGEMIQIGSAISSVGGTATSNKLGDELELVYKPSDTTWHAIPSGGSWVLA